LPHTWAVRRTSRRLLFIASLLLLAMQGVQPSAGEERRVAPGESFHDLRVKMLELELSGFHHSLSPYQLWLIYYWRGEYLLLLDVDSFIAAAESWKARGSQVTADLPDLFEESRGYYYPDLVTQIRSTDLDPSEKEFLELFLIYILNQGEDRFRSGYELNELAEGYLSRYPYSPFRDFIQKQIYADLPPRLWQATVSWTFAGAFPSGSIRSYFSWRGGMRYDLMVSYAGIALTPSLEVAWGIVKMPFSYGGEAWSGGVMGFALDLSLGYRLHLSRSFAILPQAGLGLLNLFESTEDQEGELGPIATFSFGMVFQAPNSLLGVAYRRPFKPWDSRFEGYELVFWVGMRAPAI
jgi:hypothetical protein